MAGKKPDEKLRDKINSRTRKALIQAGKKIGKLTESQKLSPSERKSKNTKKRLDHRRSNNNI
jgi:hypothetical protein